MMASTLAANLSRMLPASGREREQKNRLFASRRRYDCKRLQVAVPAEHRARVDHGAGEIGSAWQTAPGRCPVASCRTFGPAGQPWSSHHDMPRRNRPARATENIDERVARFDRRGIGAGLVGPAGAVHFARGDPGDADMRAFGAPDRAIAIPDMRRRTGEALPGGNDRSGEKCKHWQVPSAARGRTKERGRRC